MADDAVHELTAAYALDALGPDEERAYEEHLARCEQCREQLAGFRDAAGALALAADPAAPPPGLRGRILDAARAERPNVVPLRPRWAYPVAAVAACHRPVDLCHLGDLRPVDRSGDRRLLQ